MKVLHVISSLEPAGAEVLVKNLAIIAKNNGNQVDVAVFKKTESFLIAELKAAGIGIYFSPYNKFYSLFNIFFLWKHLEKYNYHIIHAHLTSAQYCLGLINFFKSKKLLLITTEHNTFNRRRNYFFFKWIDKWIYSQYKKIICISLGTKQALETWIPDVRERCVLIYNGINLDIFKRSVCNENLAKLKKDNLMILCIGRLEEQKNQAIAIKAMADIEGVHLCLVGNGSLKKDLISLASNLKISHKVHFLGQRIDIPNILKCTDIYLQPSLWEGFGIAVLEAMASGLPVVVSNVAGLNEIVDDAGLFYTPEDIESLKYNLKLLIDNPLLRRELSSKSYKKAKSFCIYKTANEYEKIYQSIY